ncbi:3-deoxy-manno-octulosonate cytidylyltransferase [Geopsychrobacter electrodiphilus]|uniref:3-deoxy-manno-octulosonate cytidylyltransferase n=1 Tax=Geopsychrobacter electrodiphilus TaxID=225196 RepID=UPI00035E5DB6|nr:3-deoxy-manno-octulosonate cytidylyltransferase [Geopsychrobacter electrodiphilus]
MKVTAVIPARFASTRFPGKPLALILGKTMIEHVYRRTLAAQTIDQVLVATDDQRIFDEVLAFGGEVMMTRGDHPSGTDRLAEVAAKIDTDIVVNVQGDEPLIVPQMIDEAVRPLLNNPALQMGTLCSRIDRIEDYLSPNVVKLVCDQQSRALYFSRAPIPAPRDIPAAELGQRLNELNARRHIGLYVYRREFLLRYPLLPQTPLEILESLEQLRAMEHGIDIHVALTSYDCHGVDTPEDLQRVAAIMQRENLSL